MWKHYVQYIEFLEMQHSLLLSNGTDVELFSGFVVFLCFFFHSTITQLCGSIFAEDVY